MKAKTILLIIAVLVLPVIVSAASINFPFLEHGCYVKYANKDANYSFVFQDQENSKVSSGNSIVINSFDEMCRYSASPSKCYECITLGRYGLKQENKSQDHNNDSPISRFKPILILAVIILLAIILIQFKNLKKKTFKSKKNKK